MRRATACAVATLLAACALMGACSAESVATLAAGTRLRFHLTAPVSSDETLSGTPFTFVLLEPVTVGGHVVLATGVAGSGTVFLAGHAGTGGHEGDLTLRLDTVRTVDDRLVLFSDQRFEINGRNRKVQSGILGFVPYIGLGSHFIRGSEVRVAADTPIETVLERPARIADAPGDAPRP